MLLSQDEARFPMVPTLRTTLGVKGFRPQVGTLDCKDLVYVFGALNLISARLSTKVIESVASERRYTAKSKTRLMQEAFAAHLRDIARAYPAAEHKRVVLVIDNAPWHRGQLVRDTLDTFKHLELYRLPSYSPQLNVIERFWKLLRRRATHNRLFRALAALRKALRASLSYYQTLRHRLLTLIQRPKKRTKPSSP